MGCVLLSIVFSWLIGSTTAAYKTSFHKNDWPNIPKVHPSAARPSLLKTRRFPSPPHGGFGFVGTASIWFLSTANLRTCQLQILNSGKWIITSLCLSYPFPVHLRLKHVLNNRLPIVTPSGSILQWNLIDCRWELQGEARRERLHLLLIDRYWKMKLLRITEGNEYNAWMRWLSKPQLRQRSERISPTYVRNDTQLEHSDRR